MTSIRVWGALAAVSMCVTAQEPVKVPGTKRVRAVAVVEPGVVTIPDEFPFVIRMEQKLSTKTHLAGQTFKASLVEPVVIGGEEVAGAKAEIEGAIIESSQGGKVKDVAHMILEIRKVRLSSGRWLDIKVKPEIFYAKPSKLRDGGIVAGTTAAGAVAGGVAGGGDGAVGGALAGAAVGTAAVLLTKGRPVEFEVEEKLVFRTKGVTSYEVPK
jgi:hypothetical protein